MALCELLVNRIQGYKVLATLNPLKTMDKAVLAKPGF